MGLAGGGWRQTGPKCLWELCSPSDVFGEHRMKEAQKVAWTSGREESLHANPLCPPFFLHWNFLALFWHTVRSEINTDRKNCFQSLVTCMYRYWYRLETLSELLARSVFMLLCMWCSDDCQTADADGELINFVTQIQIQILILWELVPLFVFDATVLSACCLGSFLLNSARCSSTLGGLKHLKALRKIQSS